MRLAALIFGIIGALATLIGAIIAILIGILNEDSSYDYADFVQGLIENMGGVPGDFSVFGDFERLLAMGLLSLIGFIVGCVGIGFAMFKPKVALWLFAPPSAVALLSIIAAYHSAPGLIILASFAMVFFMWAAGLEYADSKQGGSVSDSEETETGEASDSEGAAQEA